MVGVSIRSSDFSNRLFYKYCAPDGAGARESEWGRGRFVRRLFWTSRPSIPQNPRHILLAFLLASWRLCVRFRPKPISLPMNLRGFIGSDIKGDPGNPSFILVWEEK